MHEDLSHPLSVFFFTLFAFFSMLSFLSKKTFVHFMMIMEMWILEDDIIPDMLYHVMQ